MGFIYRPCFNNPNPRMWIRRNPLQQHRQLLMTSFHHQSSRFNPRTPWSEDYERFRNGQIEFGANIDDPPFKV